MKYILITLLFISISACSITPTKNPPSPSIVVYKLNTDAIVGTTHAGQKIKIGGFSSLQFVKSENSKLHFFSITDRGPNAHLFNELAGVGINARPFLLPEYSPLLLSISTSSDKKTFIVDSQSHFKLDAKNSMTGLPHKNFNVDETELAIDIYGKALKFDNNGIDSEGFCTIGKNYLVSEEYGPDLFMFNSKKQLIKKWTPGVGLPAVYAKRLVNRGLEGLACSNKYAYLMLQSPLKSDLAEDKNYIRIAKFDPKKGKTIKEYFYPVNSIEADKVGDIALINETKILVIEQNGKLGSKEGVRKIYRIDLSKANSNGQLQKELVVDLNALGFDYVEKIEGIAVIDSRTIAIITDNDFALNGQVDLKTGLIDFGEKPNYLAVIHLVKDL
ncbi:MAG: esterase-like activity of phytase family protein [Pseudobdellovibrio sp.]